MSERDCSYASQVLPENLLTSGTFSHERSMSLGNSRNQSGITLHNGTSMVVTSLPDPNSPERPSNNSPEDPTLDQAINLKHMELLIHLSIDEEIFCLGTNVSAYHSIVPLALKTSLESPYLLHQLLAFSARHLAYLHPQSSASYFQQALTLQTRAVSLFNAPWTQVDPPNCVAMLLFSSILGHHLLADTLAKRDPGGLNAFMTHYMKCWEMHRGIYAIATTAWPLLKGSELERILSWSAEFNRQSPRGSQCQRIRALIDGADGLGEGTKEACRLAIHYLQIGFDAVFAREAQGNRYQMIVSWTILASPEFASRLEVKQPEVLAVLGYYALLLHYGRKLWQVGDAGAYLLGLIVDYLGPEWDHWLECPREMVARDLEEALESCS